MGKVSDSGGGGCSCPRLVHLPIKGEAELQNHFKDSKDQIPSLPTDIP